MIDAAPRQRRSDESRPGAVALLVATWAEALPLLGLWVRPHVTGMGRRPVDLRGRSAVVGAGFAGACLPSLSPGDLLLTGNVPLGLHAFEGELRTVDHVLTPAEKAALGREGVAAVDMETAWLAQAAAKAGLPFVSVRAVIDRLGDRAVSMAAAVHYRKACLALRRAVRQVLEIPFPEGHP